MLQKTFGFLTRPSERRPRKQTLRCLLSVAHQSGTGNEQRPTSEKFWNQKERLFVPLTSCSLMTVTHMCVPLTCYFLVIVTHVLVSLTCCSLVIVTHVCVPLTLCLLVTVTHVCVPHLWTTLLLGLETRVVQRLPAVPSACPQLSSTALSQSAMVTTASS